MVSKKNIQNYEKRMAKQHQKFGIRKLTVGVASVLLGVTFYSNRTASADTTTSTNEKVQSTQVADKAKNVVTNNQLNYTTQPANKETQLVNKTNVENNNQNFTNTTNSQTSQQTSVPKNNTINTTQPTSINNNSSEDPYSKIGHLYFTGGGGDGSTMAVDGSQFFHYNEQTKKFDTINLNSEEFQKALFNVENKQYPGRYDGMYSTHYTFFDDTSHKIISVDPNKILPGTDYYLNTVNGLATDSVEDDTSGLAYTRLAKIEDEYAKHPLIIVNGQPAKTTWMIHSAMGASDIQMTSYFEYSPKEVRQYLLQHPELIYNNGYNPDRNNKIVTIEPRGGFLTSLSLTDINKIIDNQTNLKITAKFNSDNELTLDNIGVTKTLYMYTPNRNNTLLEINNITATGSFLYMGYTPEQLSSIIKLLNSPQHIVINSINNDENNQKETVDYIINGQHKIAVANTSSLSLVDIIISNEAGLLNLNNNEDSLTDFGNNVQFLTKNDIVNDIKNNLPEADQASDIVPLTTGNGIVSIIPQYEYKNGQRTNIKAGNIILFANANYEDTSSEQTPIYFTMEYVPLDTTYTGKLDGAFGYTGGGSGGASMGMLHLPVQQASTNQITINYIDDTTGQTLSTKSLSGLSNSNANYNTTNTINDYVNQNYVLVNDETKGKDLNFSSAFTKPIVYNVHLKHQTKPVQQTKVIKETITYKFNNGKQAANTYYASPLTFTQTGITDLVTKLTTWNSQWSPDQSFKSVQSPLINGYTPNQIIVPAITVNNNSQDININVIYNINTQTANIKYIDDTTGKVLSFNETKGTFNQPITFNQEVNSQIKNYQSQGYALVSNNFNHQVFQSDNTKNQFEVHLTHKTKQVKRTNKVTETIYYVFKDGKQSAKNSVQTKTFYENGVQDLVTKTIKWNNAPSQKFNDIKSPIINGYTASQDYIKGPVVNFNDKNTEYTVVYSPNSQLANIKYIDDTTGKVLNFDLTNGDFDQIINFKQPVNKQINHFISERYKLVSNNFNNQTYQTDNNKNKFEVHFVHQTKPVQHKVNVTRTINYLDKNTNKTVSTPVNQKVTLTQAGTTDLVTGITTWNGPENSQLTSVVSPIVDGYGEADIKEVPTVKVTMQSGNLTVNVYYAKAKEPENKPSVKTPKGLSESPMPNIFTSQVTNTINTSTSSINKAVSNASINKSSQTVVTTTTAKQEKQATQVKGNQLPQTGNNDFSKLGILGLTGITFAGLLGMSKKKRKN